MSLPLHWSSLHPTEKQECLLLSAVVPSSSSSSTTWPVVIATAELHPGKRCVYWEKEDYWGQWSLHVPLSLTHIHTQAFPQHAPSLHKHVSTQYLTVMKPDSHVFIAYSINPPTPHPGDIFYVLVFVPCLRLASLFSNLTISCCKCQIKSVDLF